MSVLGLFPEDMRCDVEFIVRKYAPPGVVHNMLFTDTFDLRAKDLLLVPILFMMSVGSLDDNWDPTPETFWIENIMDFLADRIRLPEEGPTDLDTYRPDLPRPRGMRDFLDLRAAGPNQEFDALFWDGDSHRPPRRLEAAAPKHAGGWIDEVDGPVEDGTTVPAERIVGRWKVDDDGRLTAMFRPNPAYRPDPSAPLGEPIREG
ncbi:MAG: hypothetical protein LBR32_04570 [Propionibacteriaceae bacterium]|jgi:hypothetical protein|nr:hypothetical protein [Propionibacteriaceae bacterium]